MFWKRKYGDGFAKFEDGTVVHDKDVATFVKKHLRFVDRFDIRKVVESTLLAFDILSGRLEKPTKENWKF